MANFSRVISIIGKMEPADFVMRDPIGRGDRYDFVIFHTDMMFSYDGSEYFPLQKNTCVLFKPFIPQYYYANGEPMKNSFLVFSVAESYFEQCECKFNTPIKLSDSQTENILLLMDRASYIINTDFEPQARPDIPFILDNVFHILDEANDPSVLISSQNERNIKLLLLRKKLMTEPENWTAAQMADYCHYNPTYFGKLYKKLFNTSPTRDRDFFLVEKIKLYLTNTSFSLEAIAGFCNINSVPYLIHLFKSFEHQTPAAWRKEKNSHKS